MTNTPNQNSKSILPAGLQEPKIMTLCFLIQGHKVLLGMKKRGLGEGNWNGFGGKLRPNETIFDAARREFKEEADITVNEMDMRGHIIFVFDGNPVPLKVHVFVANKYLGTPKETEEMRPQWFNINEIPLDQMWEDDKIWLKSVLAGESLRAEILLSKEGKFLKHNVKFFKNNN